MNIDAKIDMYLKKLYDTGQYTMFATELYRNDKDFHYMSNVPNIIDQTMIDRGLITIEKDVRMLTALGIEISQQGGWKQYLINKGQAAKKESESQLELQTLTKKQLELSIREMQVNFTQIRYWWLILIFTIITSGVVGAWLQSLFK